MSKRRSFTYWYQGKAMLSFRSTEASKMERLWEMCGILFFVATIGGVLFLKRK